MFTLLAISNFVAAMMGLMLPGYTLARSLRLKNCWIAAFPFSVLIMVELIVFFAILQIPVRFTTMAVALCGWTALNYLLLTLQKLPPLPDLSSDEKANLSSLLQFGCIGLALLVVLAVAFRTTMYPLSGFDTFFRWEALARAMLQHESLNFYPPVSAKDFSIYVYTDGIPPLVSTVYWWVYACIGKPQMSVTAAPVTLQLVSVMALTFYGTSQAFGLRAAYFSLAALSVSTLFIGGVAIGQETGFTALSVAGQLCFAWAAVRNPRISLVISAALFAALGALARDYGPALSLAGFATLAWHSNTRKYLPLFVIIVIATSAPWYLRNWELTGNPLYSHAVLGGFHVNAVHTAIIESYKEIYSFYRLDLPQWLNLLGAICIGAPLAVLAGLPYLIAYWRNAVPLLITTVLIVTLWVWSLGQTAGGALYSLRMLTPAVVALSMSAGAAFSMLMDCTSRYVTLLRNTALVLALFCGLYAAAFSFSHPFSPQYLFSAIFYSYTGTPESCMGTQSLANQLQATSLPSTGVLTSNAYLATILQRDTRFRPVMVWSPEVSFVFDRHLTAQEIQRRLLRKHIGIISLHSDTINNRYLYQFPLYHGLINSDQSDTYKLVAAEGDESLYMIISDRM
jgi:hypothetical protein